MTTLKAFSDKERAYHIDQARQDFLRQQRSIQREVDDERAARAAERHAKEAALQRRSRMPCKRARPSAKPRKPPSPRSSGSQRGCTIMTAPRAPEKRFPAGAACGHDASSP